MVTHLSLFSGIGGIDLAAHWAGFRSVGMVEREPFCKQVLAKNFPGVPIFDDVKEFDGSQFRGVTLVSAGFPCPPHSVAGKRLASRDERDLWGDVVRILGEAKPRWFVGENVSGILTSEHGRFFGRVVDDLVSMGFRVGWCMFGACDVEAPHERDRVFILAHSDNESGLQADPSAHSVREYGESWEVSCRSDWGHIRNQNWDRVSVKPTIHRDDDGFSKGLDESRLKALGNAVVPQQILPIMNAISHIESRPQGETK